MLCDRRSRLRLRLLLLLRTRGEITIVSLAGSKNGDGPASLPRSDMHRFARTLRCGDRDCTLLDRSLELPALVPPRLRTGLRRARAVDSRALALALLAGSTCSAVRRRLGDKAAPSAAQQSTSTKFAEDAEELRLSTSWLTVRTRSARRGDWRIAPAEPGKRRRRRCMANEDSPIRLPEPIENSPRELPM